jgi:hypothetical protein
MPNILCLLAKKALLINLIVAVHKSELMQKNRILRQFTIMP